MIYETTIKRILVAVNASREWVGEQLLNGRPAPRSYRRKLILICTIIFLLALAVRLNYWQDNYAQLEANSGGALSRSYREEARRIADDGGILYPSSPIDRGDIRMIVHPPGYSILMAILGLGSSKRVGSLIVLQIIIDSIAAVLVVLIGAQLFSPTVAIAGALFVALSPHFSYQSVNPLPDSLSSFFILLAVMLTGLSINKKSVWLACGAGAMLGISCWLRANALLLAPFLAFPILMSIKSRGRWLQSGALVVASAAVISPITVRNLVVFRIFAPLSVTVGLTLIEGIADYDVERKFGMPQTDGEASIADAEWSGREDYRANLWRPDGIARENERFSRGLQVVRTNPGWFLGVMLRRAGFMLRYDRAETSSWPLDTASVPMLADEVPFSHPTTLPAIQKPVWQSSPKELMVRDGSALSREGDATTEALDEVLRVRGDKRTFGDQLAILIPVKRYTDYILDSDLKLLAGKGAIKITTVDRRRVIASEILRIEPATTRKERKGTARGEPDQHESDGDDDMSTRVPFASGPRDAISLVLSNNGASDELSIMELRRLELFEVGETPAVWTRSFRGVIRGIQKNLFTTGRMLSLVIIGFALVVFGGKGRVLLLTLPVPLYFLCVQSMLHTEYRYILSMHYFLFLFAGISLFVIWKLIVAFVQSLFSFATRKSRA